MKLRVRFTVYCIKKREDIEPFYCQTCERFNGWSIDRHGLYIIDCVDFEERDPHPFDLVGKMVIKERSRDRCVIELEAKIRDFIKQEIPKHIKPPKIEVVYGWDAKQ